MWRRISLVIFISSAAIVSGALYVIYRLVDPFTPRHLVIAASTAGSGYDNVAKRYALMVARHGVELRFAILPAPWTIWHSCGIDLLACRRRSRRSASPNRPTWTSSIRWVGYSTQRYSFTETPSLLPCLPNSGASALAWRPGNRFTVAYARCSKGHGCTGCFQAVRDLDYATSIDALISGSVDVAIVPAMENVERTIAAPGIRLMSVAKQKPLPKPFPD